MWKLSRTHPLGRLSMRKASAVLALIVALIIGSFLTTTIVQAAGEAQYLDGTVIYDGNTYKDPETLDANNRYDLPEEGTVYTYRDGDTLQVIYFSPDEGPGQNIDVDHYAYTIDGSGNLSNRAGPDTVTLTQSSSRCVMEGIGWIVCPVTNSIAKMMDVVFNLIISFIETSPLDANDKGGYGETLNHVWRVMRDFANVAFIIVFIILIYSQLSGFGVNNYGIKKLLPRIIIGAILVNVSFIICAIAIDLSNILGHSLQDLMILLRNNILGGSSNTWDISNWQGITEGILAGSATAALGAAGAVTAATTAASAGGFIYLLLPILAGAALTVIVVLLILAARQALIALLVVIAPLAFVAYLLPNTEKWFDKWRQTFMTMLVFFPAFSLVFGGSQLIGTIIIQSAQSVGALLLGLAVQVAPLAITPLLLRLSGNVVGKVAGIINNPRKGAVDRTRKWSEDRLERRRAMQNARTRQMRADGTLGRRHVVRRTAEWRDNVKRRHTAEKHIGEQDQTTLYNQTAQGQRFHTAEHISDQRKTIQENESNLHIKHLQNTPGHIIQQNYDRTEQLKQLNTNEDSRSELRVKSARNVINTPEFAAEQASRQYARQIQLETSRSDLAYKQSANIRGSQRYQIENLITQTADEVKIEDQRAVLHTETRRNTPGSRMQVIHTELTALEKEIGEQTAIAATRVEDFAAGVTPDVPTLAGAAERIRRASQVAAAEAQAQGSARAKAQENLARALQDADTENLLPAGDLLTRAIGNTGRKNRTLANASAVVDRAFSEAVQNIQDTVSVPDGAKGSGALKDLLDEAIQNQDLEAMAAYTNKLINLGMPGISKLEESLRAVNNDYMDTDAFKEFSKYAMNKHAPTFKAKHAGIMNMFVHRQTLDELYAGDNDKLWSAMLKNEASVLITQNPDLFEKLVGTGRLDSSRAREMLEMPELQSSITPAIRGELQVAAGIITRDERDELKESGQDYKRIRTEHMPIRDGNDGDEHEHRIDRD